MPMVPRRPRSTAPILNADREGARMKKTILIALLMACGTALATEWVSVGKSAGESVDTYVDVSSLRRSGQIKRAWVKFVYAPHTHRGTADESNKWESYALHRNAYSCAEGNAKIEAITVYYDDGTQWSAPSSIIERMSFQPVLPGSLDEGAMNFVCARKISESE
jgi:hypothetical protein